jgi:hypothetical protein
MSRFCFVLLAACGSTLAQQGIGSTEQGIEASAVQVACDRIAACGFNGTSKEELSRCVACVKDLTQGADLEQYRDQIEALSCRDVKAVADGYFVTECLNQTLIDWRN